MKRRQAVKILKRLFNGGALYRPDTMSCAVRVSQRAEDRGRFSWVQDGDRWRVMRSHLKLSKEMRRICEAVRDAGKAALDQYLSANRKPFEKLWDEAAAAILAHLPPGSTIVTTEEPARPGGRSYVY